MSVTLIDGVKTVVFHNGVMRIDCIAAGPNGEERPSGTLLIPGGQARQVLQVLVGAIQELEKRLREQAAQHGLFSPDHELSDMEMIQAAEWLEDRDLIKRTFWERFGRELDLDNPQSG